MASHTVGTAVERRRWFYQRFARVHTALLVRTKGRPSGSARRGHRFLVLETVGARSGAVRHVPLLFMPRHGDFVLLASNFGQEHPPAWLANLRSTPDAHVLCDGRRIAVRARVVEGGERDELVPLMRQYNSQWNGYFDTVERQLPVVLLTRSTP